MRKFFAKQSVIEVVQELSESDQFLVQLKGKTFTRFLINKDTLERYYEEIVEEKKND